MLLAMLRPSSKPAMPPSPEQSTPDVHGATVGANPAVMSERSAWNACRFDPDSDRGHYESYFQRANHSKLPLGFWNRYTIFCPKGRPRDAVGEIWGIYFDGVAGEITAVKEVFPFAECNFSRSELNVRVGGSALDQQGLTGRAATAGHELRWSLRYTSPDSPLFMFNKPHYGKPIPKAKALVGSPNAVYSGMLTVDDREVEVDGWLGSQNHNWGVQHTDEYAWLQVAGFDDEPDSFFECGSGRIKLGPLWSPVLTFMVLRFDGQEHRFNSMLGSFRARASYNFFLYEFDYALGDVRIQGQVAAPPSSFVGLPYDNPPGGRKTCLNSKIARCQLTLSCKGHAPRTLVSENRAAFELTTDRHDHGIRVLTV